MVVVIVTFVGMFVDGYYFIQSNPSVTSSSELLDSFHYSRPFFVLIWASASGCIISAFLILSQRILTKSETMNAWIHGIKEIIEPTIILLSAWALVDLVYDVKTANWLVLLIGKNLSPSYLPMIVAIVSSLISFATGTAFGTIGYNIFIEF